MKFRLPRIKNRAFVNTMYALVLVAIGIAKGLRWLIAPVVQLTNFMRWILVKNVTLFIVLMIVSFATVWFKQSLGSSLNITLFVVSTGIFCAGLAALKLHFDMIEEKRAAEKQRKPTAPKPKLFGADVPSSI